MRSTYAFWAKASLFLGLLGGALTWVTPLVAQEPHLAYERFVLPNGLTVLVHEDHKAPVVAVDIWYHVGSANEVPGKTGFAHLFEHLMFGGSEHVRGSYIAAMQKVGATNLNGSTTNDRTNFFETVPSSSLDYALFLESDRMGYFVLNKDTLNLQRGVVQNEKRQRENQPYAVTEDLTVKSTYPALHPYSHTVIGSMDDLNAASLDDVKTWFATYYGPSNATLVLAGDITPAKAHELVEKYFGAIPPGPPVAHQDVWVAKMTGLHLQHVQDRVAQPMIVSTWNIPQFGSVDADYLDLVSDILASGKTSRLYKKLVYDMQVATTVQASADANAIAGQFSIQVITKPDADLKAVEATVQSVVKEFLAQGPTIEEMERVKAKHETDQVLQLDPVIVQAETLQQGEVFTGNPDQYRVSLDRARNATAAQLKDAADRWLSDGEYRLEVVPFPKLVASAEPGVDRSKLPEIAKADSLRLPKFERMTLKNGLQVVLAERHELPSINMSMIVKAGFASDYLATPGTASMTAQLLMDGTDKYTALQLSDQVDRLGLTVSTQASVDTSSVTVVGLSSKLKPALDLLSDIVQHPSFTADEIGRQRKLQISTIDQEKTQGIGLAIRTLPPLLFGDKHPYGMPLTGTGTVPSVEKLQRADLMHFHDEWYRPNNATLVVVGDTTLEQMKPLLEAAFSLWKPQPVPAENIAAVPEPVSHGLYLIDRPGALQSVLIAGTIAPAQSSDDEVALEMWNNILSGTFTGRLNMNLREDKHWSYGTQSLYVATRGQRPYVVLASVQTDKTKESLVEMEKEVRDMAGSRPPTEKELKAAVDQATKSLPGSRETSNAVGAAMRSIVSYHLPEDFYTTYAAKAEALQPATVEAAAKEFFHPQQLVWIVVGDRAKIEGGLKELDLGPVHYLDLDGHPIQ
jgi:zinc protease